MKIAVVGLGNMGEALLAGILNSGHKVSDVVVVGRKGSATAKVKCDERSVPYTDDPSSLDKVDVVLMCVKPQIMKDVLPEYKTLAENGALFVTVAAGLALSFYKNVLGAGAKVVRAMPNTPSLIGKGVTGIFAENLSQNEHDEVQNIFSAVGEVVWLEMEEQMHTLTAISGSGPAYFFKMMSDLAAAGVAHGMSEEMAQKLAVATAEGAGALAQQMWPEKTPLQLQREVTSPNGVTYAGLQAFEDADFKCMMNNVVENATRRSVEISTENS